MLLPRSDEPRPAPAMPPWMLGRGWQLVSLWDMIELLCSFAMHFDTLRSIGHQLESLSHDEQGQRAAIPGYQRVYPSLQALFHMAATAELDASRVAVQKALDMVHLALKGRANSQAIASEIEHVCHTIKHELLPRKLVAIAKGMESYFEKDDLFGSPVRDAFPSAREDIKAAGNCLAVELWTASVFHLMRAVEVGLRALAGERKVKLGKNKPIESAQWGEIIRAVEGETKKILQWKAGSRKAKAQEFYSGVLGEMNAFKDVYRNRASHAGAAYDEYAAKSCMQHVGDFMKRLASKISENQKRKIQWR